MKTVLSTVHGPLEELRELTRDTLQSIYRQTRKIRREATQLQQRREWCRNNIHIRYTKLRVLIIDAPVENKPTDHVRKT